MDTASGAIGGAAAGAKIGSAFGPTGTAIGGFIGGAGGAIASLFGSDGPAGLTPEAQYELGRLRIDVDQFMGVVNLLNSQYQQQLESAGYGAYGKTYGGAETGAGEYAKSAFEGKITPGAENAINQYGTGLGEQQKLSEQDIINQAVQSGRSVDSPDVQAQLAKAKTGVRSAFAQGTGQIIGQDYQNSIQNSLNAMNQARTGRIAGADVETPMQAGQSAFDAAMGDYQAKVDAINAKYDAAAKNPDPMLAGWGWVNNNLRKKQELAALGPAPDKSAFGANYGQVPTPSGPYKSSTYGQQVGGSAGAEPQRYLSNKPGTSYLNPEWSAWNNKQKQKAQAGGVSPGYDPEVGA